MTIPACTRRTSRATSALAVLGGIVVWALIAVGFARAQTQLLPTLYVNYGMTCVFTVTDDSGNPVTSIPPGTYQLQVTTPTVFGSIDQSSGASYYGCDGEIAFQITGPGGVNWTTNLSNGDDEMDITTLDLLPSSTYVLVDNNDPSQTTLSISTTATGAPSDPAATEGSGEPAADAPAVKPLVEPTDTVMRGALSATVNAHGGLTMTFHGKRLRVLEAGDYRLTVINHSPSSGLILQEIDEPYQVLTRLGATGLHTMTITLKPGQWLYYPRFVSSKHWFTVIK